MRGQLSQLLIEDEAHFQPRRPWLIRRRIHRARLSLALAWPTCFSLGFRAAQRPSRARSAAE
jgi:hypothetical protein